MKKHFLRVSVATNEDLESLINEGSCTSINDCKFDDLQDFDYAQMALVDIDTNNIIYWNDNVHGNPQDYIVAFTKALNYCNVDYELNDVVMMNTELNSDKYTGEKY